MNHTFSEVSVEVQGVIIFVNLIICLATVGCIAYYVLIAKTLPDFKQCSRCWEGVKKKKKSPLDISSSDEEDPIEYRARVDRDVAKGQVQVRADMEMQKGFKEDLGIE